LDLALQQLPERRGRGRRRQILDRAGIVAVSIFLGIALRSREQNSKCMGSVRPR
jgi:hypothetical protein